MHTRYPVCDKDKDNIIGFIHIKDLLKVTHQGIHDIRHITRPMTTVPDSMHISSLLKLMQKKKTQIAILIDEYGGTSGLVTLEDIMEEIVGEIQDEFDEERADIEAKDDGTYSINGMMLIEEVNSYFGTDIESDDYDTIGGWMYSQIENPPSKGQRIVYPSALNSSSRRRIISGSPGSRFSNGPSRKKKRPSCRKKNFKPKRAKSLQAPSFVDVTLHSKEAFESSNASFCIYGRYFVTISIVPPPRQTSPS